MSAISVYASDSDPAPDSAYVAGEVRHLVAGNRGRLLDARRTPVSVVDVAPERGAFVVGIEGFEDAGARWELWLGEVERFQFCARATTAGGQEIAELERAVARFDRELVIACDPAARTDALGRLRGHCEHVRDRVRARADATHVDLGEQIRRREGHPGLYELLDEVLAEHGLLELEERFTRTFVTNPRSGEVVKGHAIVLAELGLCPYRGQVARDPGLFAGAWSRERRADHLLRRMAFTHELLAALGASSLPLYRAAATDGPPVPARPPSSLVSATFSRAVAEAHFNGGPTTQAAVMWRQVPAPDRLLMTFLETQAMNERFHEAEAVLLADDANPAF
jgi:hypothetical protein